MEHIATPKVENVHLLDNLNTKNSKVRKFTIWLVGRLGV